MDSNRKGDNDHVSKGYKTLQYNLFFCLDHFSVIFALFSSVFFYHNQHSCVSDILFVQLSHFFFIKTSKNQS